MSFMNACLLSAAYAPQGLSHECGHVLVLDTQRCVAEVRNLSTFGSLADPVAHIHIAVCSVARVVHARVIGAQVLTVDLVGRESWLPGFRNTRK